MQTTIHSDRSSYRLQRAGSEHGELLLRLYAHQREPELRMFGWPPEQQRLFVQQQWRARNASYAACYPDALDQVVISAGQAVGRLLTDRAAHTLRLVDIALLPERQDRGLGTQLLRDLQRECARKGQSIVLHVARDNPAQRLYTRLGFAMAGQDEIYLRMEWPSR